jgi:exonuclease SbcD
MRLLLEGATPLHAALVADPAGIDAQCRAAAAAIGPDVHIERVKLLTTPAGTGGSDLAALEQAVRAALANPALVEGLLKDFERLRNVIPAGSNVSVPLTPDELADLQDDAWNIVRYALAGAPR